MRQHLAKLTPTLFLVGGCSLIYNPNNIEKPPVDASDAQMIDTMMMADARIDAPPVRDADPSMLVLEDVAPNVIYEGQGQGGSRPALLVIKGMHIIPNAAMDVTISPSTGLTIGQAQVSANGNYIAVPVSVAVDGAMTTATTPLTITVMQQGGPSGGAMLAGKLSLQTLPHFPSGTSFAVTSLAPLYSEVNTTSNVTFTGDATQRAIIKSVSSIRFGNVTVAGAAGAAGTNFGAGGPGGCPGGGAGTTGGCAPTDGAGNGAAMISGGGGGGFSSVGGPGVGADGGAGGVAHGNAQIVNYAGTAGNANQGAGGGGGAAQLLANAGAGGGGGGTVELTAGGNITVGAVNANGGAGGSATGVATSAGGGGGGSGGVVVLRSDNGMITAASVTATGGAAGGKVLSGGGGGAGSDGRVRIDVAGTVPSSVSPPAHVGPSYAANTMTIVTTDNPTLMLSGTTDDIVDAYVIDADDVPHFGEPMNQKFVNGQLSMQTTMLPGYNKFCVTLRPGTRGQSLADKCIEIAYLP